MVNEANLRNFIGSSAKEAVLAEEDERETTPNVRQDGDMANTPFSGGSAFEREEPPKDHMRRYWRQYETTPLVREPVNAFARQVVEPGYRVVADDEILDEEELRELHNWLQKCAILEKEPDKDLRGMLRKAVIQREVRGTALIEKVYAEEDAKKLYGLAFLNAETVRPNTRPGQPLLLLPDDKPGDFEGVEGELPKTEDGLAAAYTQYTTSSGYGTKDPNSEDVNNFGIDDVIKLTRDADVNEAWGTSRLESVSAEIEGLKHKMRDQNEAIASKAYPLWLFLFGTEDQPWDSDDINRFMNAHEMDEFHPGLKQGVRGDVDIKTISGEVADIIDYLEFDVNYIMSSMPMPKYILGAFEANINQFVSRTQERNVNRQIKGARRELESEFSEVVQQKARELHDLNDEEAEKVKLKMGIPGEESRTENPNVNQINYNGANDDGDDQQQQQQDPHEKRNSWGYGGPTNGANGVPDDPDKQNEEEEAQDHTVWDVDVEELGEHHEGEAAELADPRLVGTSDVEDDLATVVEQVMKQFRESTLQEVRREYSDAPYAASMAFEGVANTRLNEVLRNENFTDASETVMGETVQRTLDTLEQDNQPVTLETNFGYTERQSAQRYAQSARDAVRNAMEGLANRMDNQLSRGANNGEELESILKRIENSYSDDQIAQRAQVIARMEVKNAVESTKLSEFEQDDNVVGVQVINPCTQNTTPLCRDLAGCGTHEGAVAELGDGSLSEQWTAQSTASERVQGFDPLPPVPPFHFGCRSSLIPLAETELEEKQQEKPVYTVDQLEAKYDIEVVDE